MIPPSGMSDDYGAKSIIVKLKGISRYLLLWIDGFEMVGLQKIVIYYPKLYYKNRRM
jgi:hypothetical protein